MAIEYKKGDCSHPECKSPNNVFLVKKLSSGRICNKCNLTRLAGRKDGNVKKKYKYIKEITGEGALFEAISQTREHVCFITGEPLGDLNPTNFLHVIPKAKNKYPLYKLFEKNIVLGSYDSHYCWDNKPRSELINLPEWQKMFALEAELKAEYAELLKQQL